MSLYSILKFIFRKDRKYFLKSVMTYKYHFLKRKYILLFQNIFRHLALVTDITDLLYYFICPRLRKSNFFCKGKNILKRRLSLAIDCSSMETVESIAGQ